MSKFNYTPHPLFYLLLGLILYHIGLILYHIGLILYHTVGCGRLLALRLCQSVCLCVLAITAPHSNAKSQPE